MKRRLWTTGILESSRAGSSGAESSLVEASISRNLDGWALRERHREEETAPLEGAFFLSPEASTFVGSEPK